MKKVTLLAAAAIVALSMASCKKTYHCECSAGGFTAKGASVEMNKKDADTYKKSCENGSASAAGVTCKLVKE